VKVRPSILHGGAGKWSALSLEREGQEPREAVLSVEAQGVVGSGRGKA